MTAPASLLARLALGLGLSLGLLWLVAAVVTVIGLRHEMDEVFDSALEETAQRLLPLAVLEIVNRDDPAQSQSLARVHPHDEFFTYVVRDPSGALLMQSHAADPALFPVWDGPGFRQDATHRFYGESALQGSIRLTVAEPLAHRRGVLREIMLRQGLPLLAAIPLTLMVVILLLRWEFRGIRRFRKTLAERGAQDLSPVPTRGLPSELLPVAATLNTLLAGLSAAFAAEREFSANAAHELRTPLAGAIAQTQRLQAEARDPGIVQRAVAIEETLKRLTRTAERLMQMARAEGAQVRSVRTADLRPVLAVLVEEVARQFGSGQVRLSMPQVPVMSDLDADALAILCRNLIDNALRHGDKDSPVAVTLDEGAVLTIDNECDPLSPEALARLTQRFARAGKSAGAGLGLAIAATLADRLQTPLTLHSPSPGMARGFRAQISLSAGGAPVPRAPG